MSDETTDADLCRANGWGPGTVLETEIRVGKKRRGYRIVITAVGERVVLARHTHTRSGALANWTPADDIECITRFGVGNDWTVVAQPPPDHAEARLAGG